MIWIILAIIAFIFACIDIWDEWYDVGACIGMSAGAFVVFAMLACLLSCITSFAVTGIAKVEYSLVETTEIVALNDSSAASGQFFLGSGTVDEQMQYYFIEQTAEGKHLDKIPAANAFITENNQDTPRIERYSPKWANKSLMQWFTFLPPSAYEKYQIYIPENSVTTNFSVDLQSGILNTQEPEAPAPTTTTNYCSTCNHQLGEGANFCPNCGSSTAQAVSYCTNCGRTFGERENYCPSCGTAKQGRP